jgi:hypothetical protein
VHAASPGDGVLTTIKSPALSESVRQAIETFVHEAVTKAYVKLAGKVFANALAQSKTTIFPQIEYQFGQSAALEALKHPAIKRIILQSHEEGLEAALDQHKKRVTQDILQRRIRNKAEADVQRVLREPVFRLVMEQMIPRAIEAHRQIMVQQVLEQQTQLAYMEEQQRSTQRAIQQEILQSSSNR